MALPTTVDARCVPVRPVGVVIPLWNGERQISRCLDALMGQTTPPDLVVVVDNGSADRGARLAKAHPIAPNVVSLGANFGFAGGVNHGIRECIQSGMNSVALLNSDAYPDKDWLRHLVLCLEQSGLDCAAVAPRMVSVNGTIDSTGECLSNWGLPFPRGRGEPDTGQYMRREEILAASGGASIFKVAALLDVGLFSEDFFAYYEDVDFGLRARLRGWRIMYEPTATVIHEIGATSAKVPGLREFLAMKNMVLLNARSVPLCIGVRLWPRLAVYYTALCLALIARRRGRLVLRVIKQLIVLTPRVIHTRSETRVGLRSNGKNLKPWIVSVPPVFPGQKSRRPKNGMPMSGVLEDA